MVKTDSGNKVAPAITSSLFLTSIKSWYNDEGISVAVESIGGLNPNPNNDAKVSFPIELGLQEDMPKCRARVIGEDGKVVMTEDEMGNEVAKIEIIKNPETITIWLSMNVEDPENDEYKIYSLGSAFPLVNYAFAKAGEISPNNKKNLIFSYDELIDVLEGLEFRVKTETRDFNGRKYQVLIPADL